MTGDRQRSRPWSWFAAVGALALLAAFWGAGLGVPQRSRGLFLVSSAVLISGGVSIVATYRTQIVRWWNRVGSAIVIGLPALAVLLLAVAYHFQESITLFPFDNRHPNHDGQPSSAFMPFWLPSSLESLVAKERSRQAVVDVYTPGGVEFALNGHEALVFWTTAIMALTYSLIFSGVSVVGAIGVILVMGAEFGAAPRSTTYSSPVGAKPTLPAARFTAFISHSSEDAVAATAVCEHLEDRGFRCWIAPRDLDAGVSWSERILIGIEACPAFLLLVSRNVRHSKYVPSELQTAVDLDKMILPLFLEEGEPEKNIALPLKRIQWIHIGNPPNPDSLQKVEMLLRKLDSEPESVEG